MPPHAVGKDIPLSARSASRNGKRASGRRVPARMIAAADPTRYVAKKAGKKPPCGLQLSAALAPEPAAMPDPRPCASRA